MATYVPAKKNADYIFYTGLVSQANTKVFQSDPTMGSGDFQISKDGGSFSTLANLPAATPGGSKMVKFHLTDAEMNADNITIICSDASGAQWCDKIINIQTSARQIDNLAYPATSGRSLAVDSNGRVDLGTWLGSAPDALASGKVKATLDGESVDANLVSVDGSTTVNGLDLQEMFTNIIAALQGNVERTGNTYTYKKQDGSTMAFRYEVSAAGRTEV